MEPVYIATTFVILAFIFDSFRDKVCDHFENSIFAKWGKWWGNDGWISKRNDDGKVKWLYVIIPQAIDGRHLFASIYRFCWLNACYFFGGYRIGGEINWANWFYFILAYWLVRRVEHFAAYHKLTRK